MGGKNKFWGQRRRQRFVKQMQQAANRLNEIEARHLAEECVTLDNEALDAAEAWSFAEDTDTPWWQ